ncbi:type ISP restriction/modification enzyme [Parathermosynechococcus lividus]
MTKIYHAHLYGNRDSKYDWLQTHNLLSTNWQDIQPQAPFYLLIPQNTDLLSEYEQGWKITYVMPVNSVGIVTARDSLTIHWTKEEAWKTVTDFANLEPEEARKKYGLSKDSSDWKVTLAQEDLRKSGLSQKNLAPILYRPFDVRYTYYTGNSGGFHCRARGEVMKNLLSGKNVGFHLCRQISIDDWAHVFAISCITDDCYVSNKTSERGYTLPLYLYPDRTELTQDRRSNFSFEFLQDLTDKLGTTPSPEAIFYYIYAVFHSPTYRRRYAEFLKIDFPRVPLTRNAALFQQLAAYGEALVALHLMKSAKLDSLITQYQGNAEPVIDPGYPKFVPHPLTPATHALRSTPKQGEGEQEGSAPLSPLGREGGTVLLNKKGDGFTGVPEAVWNFYVGGYQVCHKWLKDRKGRMLSPEDIAHYQRIVVALQETIRLMKQIDAAIPGWPLE